MDSKAKLAVETFKKAVLFGFSVYMRENYKDTTIRQQKIALQKIIDENKKGSIWQVYAKIPLYAPLFDLDNLWKHWKGLYYIVQDGLPAGTTEEEIYQEIVNSCYGVVEETAKEIFGLDKME